MLEGLTVLPDEGVGETELDYPSRAKKRQGSELIEDLGNGNLLGIELRKAHGPVAVLKEGFSEVIKVGITESAGLAGDYVDRLYFR